MKGAAGKSPHSSLHMKTLDEKLLRAADAGDELEFISSLLARGADVNAVDAEGRSALHYAAQHGDIELAELLLAHGADIEARGNDSTPLMWALFCGEPEFAIHLLQHGANACCRDGAGLTPLHICVSADAARELLAHGAELEARNASGCTPLHWQCFCGWAEVVAVLLKAGASITPGEDDGWTPLRYAEYSEDTEAAALLRAHGATH